MKLSQDSVLSGQGRSRRALDVTARHPAKARSSHATKRLQVKKRDIRTSFLRTSAVQELPTALQQQQQPLPLSIPALVPPPVVAVSAAAPAAGSPAAAALNITPPVSISLGDQSCNSSSSSGSGTIRGTGEPVVASMALALDTLTSEAEAPVADLLTSSSSSSSLDSVDSVWSSNSSSSLNSLAALDKALDGLILSPTIPSSSSSSSKTSKSPCKSNSNSSSSKKASKKADAAAVPALVSIACESDWDREVAAAAASGQLLVLKVEAAQSPMHSFGAVDPTLRFQTHSIFPTSLNAYHSDLHSGFNPPVTSLSFSSSSSSSSFGGSQVLFTSANDFSFPVAGPASSGNISSASHTCQLSSPVHDWYKTLASQYATSTSKQGVQSPLRFLSLQSDGPRAKSLCRKLGVFDAVLSALVFDAAKGRKLLEVCGTKVEQELPAGLLYFGDIDTEGRAPSKLLPRITSQQQLDAARTSSDVAVVAFQMKSAPTMHKTYKHLYEAAQANEGTVSFSVMDVDCNDECSAISTELGLERLPTYIVYAGGKEVRRMSRTHQRKVIADVVQEVLGEQQAPVAAEPSS